ncbi:MAG: protein-tyrosine-phosphatase [Saprospirales bacterium]|nr:MAG: protein-tyrosine-phosphatase [Saprospirales bacterium]
MQNKLYPKINHTLELLNTNSIGDERKEVLKLLIGFIHKKVKKGENIRLNFICTHNSRRSHLSQVWAQTLAQYYDIPKVTCYSGGTESTALFPAAAEALTDAGFQVLKLSDGDNPIYSIKFSPNAHPVIGFSKTFDHPFNPESDYAAVMTCAQADEGCPFIPGADLRVPLTYEDPKKYDNHPEKEARYKERSLQIATEMKYIFSQIIIK